MSRRTCSPEHGFTPARRSAEHGFTPARRSAEHGFTLVEVMVALMIFGLLAVACVGVLSFSVRAQGAAGAKLDDLSAVARTASLLSADLAQAADRPTRDEGGTLRPAFVGEGGSDAQPMLTFVRRGWTNIDGDPRPSAQKVAYRVSGGALERIAWPMLDGAAPGPAAAILDHVAQAQARYRYRGAWSGRWDGAGGAPLPQAMEISIRRDDGSVIRQVLLIGTGYAADTATQVTPGAPN